MLDTGNSESAMHAAFDESRRPLPGSTEALVADIIAMEKEKQALQERINEKWNPLLKLRMYDAYEIIASINHREAPGFGQNFLNILHESGCGVQAKPSLPKETLATYNAYGTDCGRINTMYINPTRLIDLEKFRMQDALILCNSVLHEGGHAIHNYYAPVMEHSPCNPTTNVILHPISYIKAVIASEQDAYRVQGHGNFLLAKKYPLIRETTKLDPVSVTDFEAIADRYPGMPDRVVSAALMSLTRINQFNITFEQGYQRSALEIYQGAIRARIGNGETERKYVVAEAQDLWQIGNHGLGPNSFGQIRKEPLFFKEPKLLDQDQALLDSICKEFNIRAPKDCKTLQQHYESLGAAPKRKTPWAVSAFNNLMDAVGMGSPPPPQAFA